MTTFIVSPNKLLVRSARRAADLGYRSLHCVMLPYVVFAIDVTCINQNTVLFEHIS